MFNIFFYPIFQGSLLFLKCETGVGLVRGDSMGASDVLYNHVLSNGFELVRDPLPVSLIRVILDLQPLCPRDQHPLRPHRRRVGHRLEPNVHFLRLPEMDN
jgi:hypothetical protein